MQLRQPRLAEMVADALRQQILTGGLNDGDMLPNQEKLLAEFRVSKPSVREALRILETEGLITVQRGNVGGAVVHLPKPEHAAYTLALVLQSRRVRLHDVGMALKELEPICASHAAEREDRREVLVPLLADANARAREFLDEDKAFAQAMADFHEALIVNCGNETLALVAGAIESLWHAHIQEWVAVVGGTDRFPEAQQRRAGLREHEQLLKLIEGGDGGKAARLMARHFNPKASYTGPADAERPVTAAALRVPGIRLF